MLLRYFTCRTVIEISLLALIASMAALLAPLLSMVTFAGTPLGCMALAKKRMAAALSRLAVRRKSTVLPSLSTARYRYFQIPLTLMYVSSIRQLTPTGRLCLRKTFSRAGRNRIDQRLIEEGSTNTPRSCIISYMDTSRIASISFQAFSAKALSIDESAD